MLINSFEEEPLPNFDQRQSLAKLLGMTPRSVQIWFQNRRQRLKPMQPKQSGIGQAIGGGHCLTTPPTRGSGGSSLNQTAPVSPSQHTSFQNLAGMASLAAVTGMQLGNGPPPGFESLMMSAAMNQLQQQAITTAAIQAAASSAASTAYNGNHHNNYDVMEPFAATKAFAGLGYTGHQLASLSPASQPAPAPHANMPAMQLAALQGVQQAGGVQQGRGCCPSPTHEASTAEAPAADGLALLLACAEQQQAGQQVTATA